MEHNTYDLQSYKEAKIVLPHLVMIAKILDLSERSLYTFQNYIPAIAVLKTIREQKQRVADFQRICESIIKNKGKKINN